LNAPAPPKVIKRYANRKLYDTERSCYVTLDEIAQMVKDGEDVRVVDNKTKDDLTAITLAQIIVEEEKKVSRMPLKLLRNIIQSGEAIGDAFQKNVADPVSNIRDDVERRVTSLFRRDDKDGAGEEQADGEGGDTPDGEADDEQAGVVRELVSSTQEAFESWQRRIDDRVKEALSRMTHLTHVGSDVSELKSRIDELEARLKQYDDDA
jgi:polyhydroxyalkanoate synthesis repressor PhaR